MFRWRLLSRKIHLCHNKYVEAAPFSSPENSSVHTIVTGKYSLRLYMGHFAPVYFMWQCLYGGFRSFSTCMGICVLIGQSELSTLCPVPGLLINSPGYEVEVWAVIFGNQIVTG